MTRRGRIECDFWMRLAAVVQRMSVCCAILLTLYCGLKREAEAQDQSSDQASPRFDVVSVKSTENTIRHQGVPAGSVPAASSISFFR